VRGPRACLRGGGLDDHDVAAGRPAHRRDTSAAGARCACGGVGGRSRPAPGEWLHIDIDATLTIDHSDNKENAAPTWKKTFGHHPLLALLDRPEIAGGEALAGLLRSNTPAINQPRIKSLVGNGPIVASRRS
jgi:hypothetical protein